MSSTSLSSKRPTSSASYQRRADATHARRSRYAARRYAPSTAPSKTLASFERSPADRLRLASIDHLAAAGPVEYLAEETVSHLREHALKLGPVSSLAICMLHETPASLRRIAGLAATDFARDRDGEAFAMLGQSRRSQAPWPISQQILDAVEALKSEHHRLISPRTKNPNIPMVKTAVEETRLAAGVDAPKLVEALKNVHRRRQRELCASVRLEPIGFLRYRRALLKDPGRFKPL